MLRCDPVTEFIPPFRLCSIFDKSSVLETLSLPAASLCRQILEFLHFLIPK